MTSPAPAPPAYAGADGGAFAATSGGANHRADGGSGCHLFNVSAVVWFGVPFEAIGPDGHVLAVGGVQARQLDGDSRDLLHLAAGVGGHDTALHPRAALGDYKAIHYQLFVEGCEEGIAGRVALRGQAVNKAHR
jgi:hypothetical protein